MNLQTIAGDVLGNVLNGQSSSQNKKSSKRSKKSANTSAADMINMDNLGKAASSIMTSPDKVSGIKKAAVDLLDKNGDGNIVDDVLGGLLGK